MVRVPGSGGPAHEQVRPRCRPHRCCTWQVGDNRRQPWLTRGRGPTLSGPKAARTRVAFTPPGHCCSAISFSSVRRPLLESAPTRSAQSSLHSSAGLRFTTPLQHRPLGSSIRGGSLWCAGRAGRACDVVRVRRTVWARPPAAISDPHWSHRHVPLMSLADIPVVSRVGCLRKGTGKPFSSTDAASSMTRIGPAATVALLCALALVVPAGATVAASESTALVAKFPPEEYNRFVRPPPRSEVTRVQVDCRLLHLYEIDDVQVRRQRSPGPLPAPWLTAGPLHGARAVHRARRHIHSDQVRMGRWAQPGRRHPAEREGRNRVT